MARPPGGPTTTIRAELQHGSPQVVPPAQDEVGLGVERGAHLAQPAVAAGALQAVLVPVLVQGLEQVAVLDLPVAAGAAFWLGVRLDGEHLDALGKEQ